MRAVLEGRLELSSGLADEIYDCLACRGCESVCPAGVPVGTIVEEFRGLITESKREGRLFRVVKRLALAGVLASPRRLAAAISLLRAYERTGLRRLVRAVLARLAPALASREALLPKVPRPTPLPAEWRASGSRPRRGRVGLFRGCIAAHLFGDVNASTARILARNGFDVVVPGTQVCCGALHLHNGLPDTARELARRNVRAFEEADVDAVIVNAAGCGAALAEYGELLASEDEARARVASFSGKVVDVAAFLVREGYEPPRRSPFSSERRVAYDPPCHLFHAQKVRDEPRAILASIPGVSLVEHRDAERCCGSAGIYNVTHHDMSMRVLDEKMDALAAAAPDTVVTGNPGCHMQLEAGARRRGLDVEVLHPAVLLDRAYAAGEED